MIAAPTQTTVRGAKVAASAPVANAVGGDAEVAGRLVQAEREAASGRAGEVDLHHDGHRPGQPLVDAEQHVGGDDEPPADGASPISSGTGSATSQPMHEHALSAERSARPPATRLVNALATPNASTNARMAAFE